MTHFLHRTTRTALALAMAGLLTACATGPVTNAQLDEARSAYASAAADANVVRSAPLELRQAQQALDKATAAAQSGDDLAQVNHYAYLARQRTEVALQAGQIAQADAAIAQAQATRDRILISARTREAEAERDAAQQARIAAEQARLSAEQSRTLAEQRLAAAQAAQKQASAANIRASTLAAQLAELQAKPTERGMVLTLGDVLFDTDRATLKPGAMRTVDKLAEFLANNPGQKILVEGHTDSVGAEAYNRALSQRRAEAVQRALADRRIASDRVETRGLGMDYPVASNGSAEGRQRNRRVEVIFSDESGVIKPRAN